MKIAIIGRTETLYDLTLSLKEAGHEICCIITAKEAPEYNRTIEDFRGLAEVLNVPLHMDQKSLNISSFSVILVPKSELVLTTQVLFLSLLLICSHLACLTLTEAIYQSIEAMLVKHGQF